MSQENSNRTFDSENFEPSPFPKYFVIRNSGKIFRFDREEKDGIFATELDKNTFRPIAESSSLVGTREKLARNVSPYPAADTEFLNAIRVSREVIEVATGKKYRVLNCNLDVAMLREEGGIIVKSVSLEILYQSYEPVIQAPEQKEDDVCKICKITQNDIDPLLN